MWDYLYRFCRYPDVSQFEATRMTIFSLQHTTKTLSTNIPHNTSEYLRAKLLLLTHFGPVTQICVQPLKPCRNGDANLRFQHALGFHVLYTLTMQYTEPFSE
jgi:hypothetical protein